MSFYYFQKKIKNFISSDDRKDADIPNVFFNTVAQDVDFWWEY